MLKDLNWLIPSCTTHGVVWYQIYLVCIDYNYAGMENVATELKTIYAGPVSARDSNISMIF